MIIDLDDFVKDRDEALLSLDKKKIEAFMEKYNIDEVPKKEIVFWASVHKAILHIRSATDEEKERSARWLSENGFSLSI